MESQKPFKVPTTDGKKIFEHFGFASSMRGDFSMAHMIAPAGWDEPFQMPQFDEFIIVTRGQLVVEFTDKRVLVGEGESVVAPNGVRVRYANVSADECEYVALCMPAFRPDRVEREGL